MGISLALVLLLATFIFLTVLFVPMLLLRLPLMQRVDAAEREVMMRFPPVVLVLKRLPDGARRSQLNGLAFGAGHVKRYRSTGFEVVLSEPDRR
jgi:hypothetical protein